MKQKPHNPRPRGPYAGLVCARPAPPLLRPLAPHSTWVGPADDRYLRCAWARRHYCHSLS